MQGSCVVSSDLWIATVPSNSGTFPSTHSIHSTTVNAESGGGVYNVVSHTVNGKTVWTNLEGTNLTQRNARAHVRGTPNPYAIECLVRCVEHMGCPSVRQHDAMPCAKLFSRQYDQKTHPATMLIYEALKFTQPPGLSQYAWHRQFMPSLIHSYERCAQQMFFGLPVV